MSLRAQELAQNFERANNEFIAFVVRLSDDEWRRMCPNERRTVAALAHHVAGGYLFEIRSFKGLADGQPLPTVTKEYIDRVNAEAGARDGEASRDQTLAMLRRNGRTAADFVRGLSDEQLQRVGAYVDWIPPMSVDQWIENVLLGHIRGHMASMQAVVEKKPTAPID